ncbi:MAG: tetratricopeptide repeat protein [Pirellulales bacterium]
MGKLLVKRLALAGLLSVGLAATGCASGSSLASNSRPRPSAIASGKSVPGRSLASAPRVAGPNAQGLNTSEPGAASKLASTVKNSSIGKSMTSAYSKTRKKASSLAKRPNEPPADPIALDADAGRPDPDFYVSVARLHEQSNKIPLAKEFYGRALALDENHLGAILGMARLHDRQGQLPEATGLYLEATRRHPKDAAALNDLGICYARQRMFNESASALARAVEAQPKKPLYRNNLATVLVELGRVDEALVHLKAVHGAAVAHYNTGFLLNRRGELQQALDQFALAARHDPSLEGAQQWVDSLSRQIAQAAAAPSAGSVAGTTGPVQSGPKLVPSQQSDSLSLPSRQPDLQRAAPRLPQAQTSWPAGELRRTDAVNLALPGKGSSPPMHHAAKSSPPEPPGAVVQISDEPAEFSEPEGRLQHLPPVDDLQFPPSRY